MKYNVVPAFPSPIIQVYVEEDTSELFGHNKSVAEEVFEYKNKKYTNGDADSFLNSLNLGDPDSNNHRRGFGDPQDVVDWFHQERSDDWRQRD